MGGIPVQQVPFLLRHNIDMTASSISKLETINEIAATTGRRARVHLKIDTGLERIGVHHYNADLFLERALECTHSDLVGIFSHFATVKQGNLNFADTQLERFLEVVRFFEKRSLPTPIRHIAASAATFQMTESHLDLVRIGAALYGLGLGRLSPSNP
jgi:alanine racemase